MTAPTEARVIDALRAELEALKQKWFASNRNFHQLSERNAALQAQVERLTRIITERQNNG